MPRHSILTICACAAWILSGTNYARSAPLAGTQSADGQTIRSGANATDVSVFYPYLAPYGKWFTLGSYGLVWSPAGVGAGWSPYANGSWVYTDVGWTWVSDDPWGWATCHYGRWLLDQAYGWVWVPGTEWAPAWVDWRMGDGYIGWAPLPPEATWDPSSGLAEVDIPAGCYSFVVEREFVTEHIKRKILLPDRNATLIKVTIRVTEYDYVNGVLVCESVSVEHIRRIVQHDIPTQNALAVVHTPASFAAVVKKQKGAEIPTGANRSAATSGVAGNSMAERPKKDKRVEQGSNQQAGPGRQERRGTARDGASIGSVTPPVQSGVERGIKPSPHQDGPGDVGRQSEAEAAKQRAEEAQRQQAKLAEEAQRQTEETQRQQAKQAEEAQRQQAKQAEEAQRQQAKQAQETQRQQAKQAEEAQRQQAKQAEEAQRQQTKQAEEAQRQQAKQAEEAQRRQAEEAQRQQETQRQQAEDARRQQETQQKQAEEAQRQKKP